jgi:hypothetical protein
LGVSLRRVFEERGSSEPIINGTYEVAVLANLELRACGGLLASADPPPGRPFTMERRPGCLLCAVVAGAAFNDDLNDQWSKVGRLEH